MMGPISYAVSRINWILDIIPNKLHDFKMEDTVVISGTPRSGSTWLMEIIETLPEYKSVFEPFHPVWYPEFKGLGIPYDPYVPEPKMYPKLKEYLMKVFNGEVAGRLPHGSYFSWEVIAKRFRASKLVVKFVRANTMLPWIARTFPLRGIYFIIRHPCATIASQLATGYYSKITLKQLINEVKKVPELANDKELLTRLSGINSEIERLAAIWAFENYIPLSSERPHPWYTVVYERLVVDPEEELKNIFQYIGEDVPEAALKRVRIPSKVTRKTYGKGYIGTPKQLIKWREKLTERQVKDILRVVSWFGIGFYTENPEPDYNELSRILSR